MHITYIIHIVCVLISLVRVLQKFRHLKSQRNPGNYFCLLYVVAVLTLCATQALPEALCVPGALREPLQEPLPVGQEETRGQALQEPRAGPQAGQVTQQGQEKVSLEGQEASKTFKE